jgi:hypothetical protein
MVILILIMGFIWVNTTLNLGYNSKCSSKINKPPVFLNRVFLLIFIVTWNLENYWEGNPPTNGQSFFIGHITTNMEKWKSAKV